MPVSRQRTQTLDGLAWASLSESAVIARVAAMLVREHYAAHREYGEPTKKRFEEAIRQTVPPRGRAGPMLEPLMVEFRRQRVIYTKRLRAHNDWAAWQDWRSKRETRVNVTYASLFERSPHLGHRQNPYDWHQQEDHRKWNDEESARDKGDNCVLLIKHQGCVIAVLTSQGSKNEQRQIPSIKVKYLASGRVFTTHLREQVDNFGSLFKALGGYAVTGALAHGHRVDIDWPGRRFIIHDPETGEKFTAPWLIRRYTKTDDQWRYDTKDLVVIGRKVIGEGDDDEVDAELND